MRPGSTVNVAAERSRALKLAWRLAPVVALAAIVAALDLVWPARAVGEDSGVVVLWSTGMSGHVEPCGCTKNPLGGLARRVTLLDSLRKSGESIVQVDAGDLFFSRERIHQGQLDPDYAPQATAKAHLILDLMTQIGLDAFTPGEDDFTAGLDQLLDLHQRAKFPWVSANLRRTVDGELLFASHVIVERGGKRIGIFGLTDPSLVLALEDPPHADDMIEAATRVVAEIRGEVDLLIALAHTSKRGGELLAKARPEIDLICGVHGPDQDMRPGASREVKIEIAETSLPRGKTLGGRKFFTGSERAADGKFQSAPFPQAVNADFSDDKEARAAIDRYVASLEKINVLPEATGAWPRDIVGASECAGCHPSQAETWQITRHAKAWPTLIEKGHAFDLDCIGCHSIGIESRAILSNPRAVKDLVGVQCEHCHGPRQGHREDPTNTRGKKVNATLCLECHYKEHDDSFDWAVDRFLSTCVESENAVLNPKLIEKK